MSDQAQWFDSLGKCRCGKPATGKVMSVHNAPMGASCEKCATKRIKAAKAERAAEAAKAGRPFLRDGSQ